MKRSDNFQKFTKKPKSGTVKEKFKQEKKKAKKERAEAIENHFAKKREQRSLQQGPPLNRTGAAPKKSYNKHASDSTSAKPGKFGDKKSKFSARKEATPKPATGKTYKEFRNKKVDEKPAEHFDERAPKKVFEKKFSDDKTRNVEKSADSEALKRAPRKTLALKSNTKEERPTPFKDKSTARKQADGEHKAPAKKTYTKPKPESRASKPFNGGEDTRANKSTSKPASKFKDSKKKTNDTKGQKAVTKTEESQEAKMPLNKYIAHSGVCSRRDAADLVKQQKVTINDIIVTDPGTKVASSDVILISGKRITPTKNFVYILLNKPKDFITTLEDPQGRKTVLDLVRQATTERIYPVGRLDRNTSGVLLLTNDGDLAQKLSHPKHEIKKVYEVKLDRNLTKGDMDKIAAGLTLEDGFIAPDVIAYADAKDKSTIGIEIHSGRNRIVRRIFEHMKYDVRALDRVLYAGLTKKNVQRGNWRFLSEKEVRLLRFMNQSYVKTPE